LSLLNDSDSKANAFHSLDEGKQKFVMFEELIKSTLNLGEGIRNCTDMRDMFIKTQSQIKTCSRDFFKLSFLKLQVCSLMSLYT
jgi:primase-polymerase (primpol)-like protein